MVSVRKRGKVYEYRIETASIDGTRKWITKSGFKTRQDALHEGALAYNDYYQYGKKQKQRDMSYADYLDYWIDNYCNFNLKYSTIVTYLNIIKLYLKLRLGKYKLSQLDTQMIQEFINELYLEKRLSKWYLKGILKTIKGSLKYAYYTVNFINDNPAERVHFPRYEVVTKDPAHIFTQEEIEIILDRFKDLHYVYYAFLTAYYTGLRVSEVFGLTWDNIDFERKTLTVNKNIIKKNQFGKIKKYTPTKGHSSETWFYGTCKNPQSRRTISIGDTLIKALKEYKKEQEEYKKYYKDEYLKHYEKKVYNEYTNREEIKIVDAPAELEVNLKEANLIFVKPNGQFRGTETCRHAFKIINYELKIPCRFHDFRDTHATRLIENGADIKAVSKRLGHSTIQTTYNIYVRVTNKMETDTVDKFEEYTNTLDIPNTKEINYLD
jgi:integrase